MPACLLSDVFKLMTRNSNTLLYTQVLHVTSGALWECRQPIVLLWFHTCYRNRVPRIHPHSISIWHNMSLVWSIQNVVYTTVCLVLINISIFANLPFALVSSNRWTIAISMFVTGPKVCESDSVIGSTVQKCDYTDSITAHNASRANYYFLAPSPAHSTPLIKAPTVEGKTQSTPLTQVLAFVVNDWRKCIQTIKLPDKWSSKTLAAEPLFGFISAMPWWIQDGSLSLHDRVS